MKKDRIKSIKAREILDSRGNPTVEVEIALEGREKFFAAVPSGASTGKNEALELRDGRLRFHGKGVLKAVDNVNNIIAPNLLGKDAANQKEIDRLMIDLDGTENKSNLGANAIIGVSMAVCRAAAGSMDIPLYKYISELNGNKKMAIPKPTALMVEGGAHAENELDFQEFMILTEADSYRESLRMISEIYHELKNIIKEKFIKFSSNVGFEGGFTPSAEKPEEILDVILSAARALGYSENTKIVLDVAASQFFENDKYKMRTGIYNREELLNYYSEMFKKYPVAVVEDPFAEEDWTGFKKVTEMAGEKITIIGDDLLVTNPKKIKEAYEKKACNGLLLKVNQIGTVSEAIEAALLAKSYAWKVSVSHRSGETCDDFISDLAVGIGADYIKTGAPARGERIAKYNRLLRIEEEI